LSNRNTTSSHDHFSMRSFAASALGACINPQGVSCAVPSKQSSSHGQGRHTRITITKTRSGVTQGSTHLALQQASSTPPMCCQR
jgi:hypothetical protein